MIMESERKIEVVEVEGGKRDKETTHGCIVSRKLLQIHGDVNRSEANK